MNKLLLTLGLVACISSAQASIFHKTQKKKAAAPLKMEIPQALNETVEFLDGLTMGIIHQDVLVDLEKCYNDAGTLRHDISHAINDFEIGGVLGYISGALRIIKLIGEVRGSFSGCSDAGTALKTIVAWAETQLSDIKALEAKMAKNYLWNMVTVNKDIEAAIAASKANDFYTSGLDIGQAVALLTQ